MALPTYAANLVAKGAEAPEATCPVGGRCFADVPSGNPFYEFINRIYQQDLVSGYPCGGAGEPCDAQNRPYYRPGAIVTRQQMAKFIDNARQLPGIDIDTSTEAYPIRSVTSATNGTGVYGRSTSGPGVSAISDSDDGVSAISDSDDGVSGISDSGNGVSGASSNGYGVYGYSYSSYAGYFTSNIYVGGSCTGCAGPSRIDHPLDPEHKYLYHSIVQSPDMKTIYDGVVTLDAGGEAEVVLPEWFEALNKEYRYQFAPIGAPMPNLYIAQEISDNRFKIAGGKSGGRVSWQVTGIRHDPYANAHRVDVEVDKPAEERGTYLHPTELGRPESSGIDYDEQQRMMEELQQAGER
jgi:hypothetical protein